MASDYNRPTGGGMSPSDGDYAVNNGEPLETPSNESGETATIPAALVDAYPNVGDTITLKVVATDPDSGIITVGKIESMEEPAGSESAASEFDEAQTPQSL